MRLIRKIILEPWRSLEEDYTPKKADAKTYGAFFVIALILVSRKYFGYFENVYHLMPSFIIAMMGCIYFGLSALIMYTLIPMAYKRFLFRDMHYGLSVVSLLKYKWLYLSMMLIMIPVVYIASTMQGFIQLYPLCKTIGTSRANFFIWEIVYAAQFFGLEFFFRGILLYILARTYGPSAIFIMMVPYVMIHFGKPLAETCAASVAGVILGAVSLYTRSIWGGVFLHTFVAWGMDIASLYQQGKLKMILGL